MQPWVNMAITVILFLITHIAITVWWASKVNTILNYVQNNLTDLVTELREIRKLFATREYVREYVHKEFTPIKKEIELIKGKM